MQLVGKRYDNGQPIWVEVHDDSISALGVLPTAERNRLPWLAPGLIDLQVNGYGGHEFTDPQLNADNVAAICGAMVKDGVTQFLPTVVTQSAPLLKHALSTVNESVDQNAQVRRCVAGIHLEGPYISADDGPRGAHPLEHCRPPDWDEFQFLQDAAGGNIRLLTLSPEYPNSPDFIGKVVASGVIVSIGHTRATTEQLRAAVDAGARLSTHLGNGAHASLRRHPNYIWDQLADDRLIATLIVDGHHLPPAVVKSFVRAKTTERVVLVSDLTGLAGTLGSTPGRYRTPGLGDVELLEDGRAVVAGQREYLAGATRPLSAAIGRVMKFADVDLATAITMASTRPAELLDLPSSWLEAHRRADLIQFELDPVTAEMNVLTTVTAGQVVHGTPTLVGNLTDD